MKNKTLRLVMVALLAAMTCVATMVIKISITATGIGSALADFLVMLRLHQPHFLSKALWLSLSEYL